MKDIKNSCIPHVSTQEEDKEEKYDLLESHMEKIEKQLESRSWIHQKLMIHYKIMGSIQFQEITLSPRFT